MHYSTLLALLFVGSTQALADNQHTMCYNYFMNKDGCVHSSADGKSRCPSPKTCTDSVPMVSHPSFIQSQLQLELAAETKLRRRYNDDEKSFFVKAGSGVCGLYKDDQPGACLWVGPKANANAATAGWLNGFNKSNCGKTLYIQRAGQKDPVYVPVVDGCSFDAEGPEQGCFRIAFTKKTFFDLHPTDEEKRAGGIKGVTWDFSNLDGSQSKNAPV